MRRFLREFKEFALRGNVMDLAVGIIIGGAFQGIVKSLVDDLISPFIGLFANTDFSAWALTIGGVEIRYGSFLTNVLNFIIMALVIFLLLKVLNRLAGIKKKEEPAAPTEKVCPYCRTKISIQATRCPHCTSVLEEEKEKEE